MAAGDFFNDLASGIFERLKEKRAEQKEIEEGERSRTLNLLTSLSSQVEPESLPVLMQHIGKVAGMKGDLGSFWQGLSGMPNTSLSGKIGTAFNQAMAGLVGPEQARKTRSMAAFTKGFTPQTPEQAENIEMYQEGARYPDRMVLRDPRAERLEDLRTQYGLQFSQKEKLFREQQDVYQKNRLELEEERTKNRLEVENKRAAIKADQASFNLASVIMADNPTLDYPTALKQAGAMLMNKTRGEIEDIASRGPYRRQKTIESKAVVDFMQNPPPGVPKGVKPGEALRIGQAERRIGQTERTIGQAQQAQGAAKYKEWSDARAAVVAAEQQLQNAIKEASGAIPGKRFDPQTRTLVDIKTGKPQPASSMLIEKQLADISKAEAEIQAGRSRMGAISNDLLRNFPDYYEIGIDNPDPGRREINPKKSFGGVAPGKAARTAQPGAQPPVGAVKAPGRPTNFVSPADWERALGTPPAEAAAPAPAAPAQGGPKSYRGTPSQRWDDPKFKQRPDGSFPEFDLPDGTRIKVTGTQPPSPGNPNGRIFYEPVQRKQ